MITFKQFVTEATDKNVLVPWKKTIMKFDPKMLSLFIQRHCSKIAANYIKQLDSEHPKYIWRGFSSGLFSQHDDVAVINTQESKRLSLHSNNAYHELLSMSPHLQDYPDRGNSLICTTNRKNAQMYGSNPSIIFPFDDTKLCYMQDVQDVLYTGGVKIAGYNAGFSNINSLVVIFAPAAGIRWKYGTTVTAEMLHEIDEKLKGLPIEWVFAKTLAIFMGHERISKSQLSPDASVNAKKLFSKLDEDSASVDLSVSIDKKFFMELLPNLNLERSLTPKALGLFNWVKAATASGFFKSISANMSPETLNMKLVSPSSTLPDTSIEIWFSGRAVVMSQSQAEEILHLLKE